MVLRSNPRLGTNKKKQKNRDRIYKHAIGQSFTYLLTKKTSTTWILLSSLLQHTWLNMNNQDEITFRDSFHYCNFTVRTVPTHYRHTDRGIRMACSAGKLFVAAVQIADEDVTHGGARRGEARRRTNGGGG